MKKLFTLLALLGISASVLANGYHPFHYKQPQFRMQHHHHHGHWRPAHHGGWEWVVPMAIGGIIVWQATRPPEPQVVIQQQQVIVESNCSPWTETQNPDGTVTRTRTCSK